MIDQEQNVISVTQLNLYLKSVLDANPILNNLLVKGEVSNLKYYPSGHIYFSLKDEEGVVKCVMFSTYASRMKELIKDGDKVVVTASLSVYPQQGTYQLYVKRMEKDGLGNLYLEFEKLKKELREVGLFDEDHKKTIPSYPRNIGIVSGKTAAGLKDVISIIKRRWPVANIYVFPCLVQGKDAPKEIIEALDTSGNFNLDVTLLVRGGGSQEDLFCFNDKDLAYAIYDYPIPIISGVGHEIDFTIADFVSDLRAPTPSGAAELATPNIDELLINIRDMKNSLTTRVRQLVNDKRQVLLDYEDELTKEKYYKYLEGFKKELNETTNNLYQGFKNFSSLNKQDIITTKERLQTEYNNYLNKSRMDLNNEIRMLDGVSPLKVLQRGYSVVSSNGVVVNSVKKINVNDELEVTLSDGKVKTIVTRKDD